ncbi:hypothetical protein BD310DRAFT_872921 [Dichomitus squalens]|uniref:Uncharacterized protein n=1 Tax=Dichomitus squalens TaxID=114155 RepID=A0A4Q9Q4M2_9APHY|nr:hypothetical protein BD310DRAFT_872921 [Dichomitus squalens]
MVAQSDKRLIWHPRGQNKFIVGGSTQITLYEWIPQSTDIKQVASQSELNQMKCFAWSPDPILDDLVAVGFSNGRVELVRFEASKHARNSAAVSLPPARNTRACNTLGFSPANPNSLAVGLDKVRNDPSLVIWDIHSALPALSLFDTGSHGDIDGDDSTILSRGDDHTRTSSDPRPVQHYASAEVVSTLSWLPQNPQLLLAGISHRWLQLFDTRTTASPAKAASKVHGIATDPFDAHRVACYSEGIVSIWDIRRFTQPILTFTSKDASADGADGVVAAHSSSRGKGAPSSSSAVVPLAHVEFSSTRRGTLATLEREASHVRFWDIHQAQYFELSVESNRSRDSSQSGGKATRTSWVKPWAGGGSTATRPSSPPVPVPGEFSQYHLVLADTRRTKTFSHPFTSFALVPSPKPHPLTSNVMLVNRDGDLELYAVHDTPIHPPWSSRGDLALGIGCSYTVIPGITDPTPPREPWELLAARPSRPGSRAYSLERAADSTFHMGAVGDSPAMFGRGDEDGFPALTPNAASVSRGHSPGKQRFRHLTAESALAVQELPFEHTAVVRGQPPKRSRRGGDHDVERGRSVPPTTPKTVTLALDDGEGKGRIAKKSHAVKALQHVVESDISMLMRKRAAFAYGLIDPVYNSSIANTTNPHNPSLSELWSWIQHSQRLVFSPSPIIEGYNFAYQGLIGIWEGFRPIRPSPPSGQPTPRMPARSALFDGPSASPLLIPSSLELPPRPSSKHTSRRRNQVPTSSLPEDFLNAIDELNMRSGSSETWKPSVSTARLSQRRFALQLCGWSLAQDDLARAIQKWEKEGKYSQAACWLVFTEQNKPAIETLMRSKDESLHMMSGMLAALTASPSRNAELVQHCERLIVRLQDPYLRALLTHLTVRDWSEVLEEDSLPLRERLAIAFQFLDDKEVSSFLRRTADRAIHDGDIHGVFITGLTVAGIELLQAYIDSSGDVQTAALVAALSPTLARESRATRWMNAYRDMLDGWRLFHHRCHLDIERGKILKEAVEYGEIQSFDWAPKQVLLRCNYCNKPIEAPFSSEANPRATLCPNCSRPLPRCSICLMTLNLAPDTGRGSTLSAIPSDTLQEALVFCQTCRHGGHASHILEWFYGEGGAASRAHGTCPIAGCECHCGNEL